MRIGSLFSGYGGLDLAVESVFGATREPSAVLERHWPNVPNLGDITKVDWSTVEPVDIITGGSPCQDLSHAGRRAGMRHGTRSGLWASMLAGIETIRPSLVVWENVRGAYSARAESELDRYGRCKPCVCGGADRRRGLYSPGMQPDDVQTAGDGGHDRASEGAPNGSAGRMGRQPVLVAEAHATLGRGVDVAHRRPRGGAAIDIDPAVSTPEAAPGRSSAPSASSMAGPRIYVGRKATPMDHGGAGRMRADQTASTCPECEGPLCGCGGCVDASDSEVEPCPGCVGDGSGVHLRALGRVLGDLADLGYDTQWHGLSASDVGAPHGRFRVFVVAHARSSGSLSGIAVNHHGLRVTAEQDSRVVADATCGGSRPQFTNADRRPGVDDGLRDPMPSDTEGDPRRIRNGNREPATDTEGDGRHEGRPEPARLEGRPDAAQRRPPAADASSQRHGRGQDPTALGRVDSADEGATRQRQRAWPVAGDRDATAATDTISGGRDRGAREPLREPLGGTTAARRSTIDWGKYEPAIRRWEHIIGRPAPPPTETGPKGGQRLSARFVEWMMGLPDGWVTDTPSITRTAALKMLGNGVVWQQAAAAIQNIVNELAAT